MRKLNENTLYLVRRDNDYLGIGKDRWHYLVAYPVYETGEVVLSGWKDQEGCHYPHYEEDEVVGSIPIIEYEMECIPLKMEKIPSYGDHMTMEDWLDCVEAGGFIDYDGHGNLATETEMSNISIRPSDVGFKEELDDPKWTHVVWFNR